MEHIIKILSMLRESYSPFHVVDNLANELLENGFEEIDEKTPFDLKKGKNYFVRRNDSSLIAFKIPSSPRLSFKVTAAHTDSPTFKIKPQPVEIFKNLIRLNVEPYGGMLMSTWMDRPLSLAGRVMVKTDQGIESRFLAIQRDLLQIPSLCIHFDRNANENSSFNPTKMLPILGECQDGAFSFDSFFQEELKTQDEILSHDLFLYNRDEPRLVGLNGEFVSSPRLDDLASTYSCLLGFIEADCTDSIDVYCAFDNEEVGSLTRQGANSTFLRDVLHRISSTLFEEKEGVEIGAANGFMMSVDNAHANHPNFPETSDATTDVRLNGGIVIKHNARQKYMTDAFSCSLAKEIAKIAGVSFSEYTNRSDMPGGSTLGNISNGEISFAGADIGIAQLAMHSSNEFCGTHDLEAMARFIKTYYSTPLHMEANVIRL